MLNLTGKRFGRLIVLQEHFFRRKNGQPRKWKCKCDCGNTTTVFQHSLRFGHTKSCGCLLAEATGNRCRTHGLSRSKEYYAWNCMRERCLNPKNKQYKDYGGRGIKVYRPWIKSFEKFIAHIGKKPKFEYSLERLDNNKGYFPGNIIWASKNIKRITQDETDL